MNKFIDHCELQITIENIKNMYNLDYNLFYILPTDEIPIVSTIIYNNITFFIVYFPKNRRTNNNISNRWFKLLELYDFNL